MKRHSTDFIFFGTVGNKEQKAELYINRCGILQYRGVIGDWEERISRKEIKKYFRSLELSKKYNDTYFPF